MARYPTALLILKAFLPLTDHGHEATPRARPRPRAGYPMNPRTQKPRIIGSYRREAPILGETPIFGWTRWRPPKNQPPDVESPVGAIANARAAWARGRPRRALSAPT